MQKRRLPAAAALLTVVAVCLFYFQRNGYFSVLDRQASPDGSRTATVYDGVSGTFFLEKGIFTVAISGAAAGTTTYASASFDGMWWSPDSRYLLVSMDTEDGIHLHTTDFVNSTGRNLSAYIAVAAEDRPELQDAGVRASMICKFMQWSKSGHKVLIFYSYADAPQSGYFWFDCETGEIAGILELT